MNADNKKHIDAKDNTTLAKNSNLYDKTRGNRILISYASTFGTTGEVAKAIADALEKDGAIIEIKKIQNVKNLSSFDAVIIGCAIHYDKWMVEGRNFVTTYQSSLSKIPVAYFFTCLTLSRNTEESELQSVAYSDKIYTLSPSVNPVSIGRFGGVLDYTKMPLINRLISKAIYSIFGIKEGDYRDWKIIRLWAKDVHSKLIPALK